MQGKRKVLVIDDDPSFIDAVKMMLTGYQIVGASDPKEGYKMIVTEKPDLIVLDIMMDSLFDGFSLCHSVKSSKDKQYRCIPILVVSALKETTGSRFGFKGPEEKLVGPDAYLDKPVTAQVLNETVQQLLSR